MDGAGADLGLDTSIALDAQGNPCISYSIELQVRCAAKSGGGWTVETVPSAIGGSYTSLALDGQGNPRIAYYDQHTHDLGYAVKSGSTWTLETV